MKTLREGAHFTASAPGAKNPSYATAIGSNMVIDTVNLHGWAVTFRTPTAREKGRYRG